MQGPPAPPLQLLGGPEDIHEVGLAGRQPGAEVLGPTFHDTIMGPLSEPLPDGLQAVFLLALPVADLLSFLMELPLWHLNDPEGHSAVGLRMGATYALSRGHQGFLLLGKLGRRGKIYSHST